MKEGPVPRDARSPAATAPAAAARHPGLFQLHQGNLPPRVYPFYPARPGNECRVSLPVRAIAAWAVHSLPAARSTGDADSFHSLPAATGRPASRSRPARRSPDAGRAAGGPRLPMSVTEAGYLPDLRVEPRWRNQTAPLRACRPVVLSRCLLRNGHSDQSPGITVAVAGAGFPRQRRDLR